MQRPGERHQERRGDRVRGSRSEDAHGGSITTRVQRERFPNREASCRARGRRAGRPGEVRGIGAAGAGTAPRPAGGRARRPGSSGGPGRTPATAGPARRVTSKRSGSLDVGRVAVGRPDQREDRRAGATSTSPNRVAPVATRTASCTGGSKRRISLTARRRRRAGAARSPPDRGARAAASRRARRGWPTSRTRRRRAGRDHRGTPRRRPARRRFTEPRAARWRRVAR